MDSNNSTKREQPGRTAGDAGLHASRYNLMAAVPDDECRECVWLPHCVGGCPHRRLFGERSCVPFKDEPERYVLALHARINKL